MGLLSKMGEWSGVDGWMDTPETVRTTKAPAVLISSKHFLMFLFKMWIYIAVLACIMAGFEIRLEISRNVKRVFHLLFVR